MSYGKAHSSELETRSPLTFVFVSLSGVSPTILDQLRAETIGDDLAWRFGPGTRFTCNRTCSRTPRCKAGGELQGEALRIPGAPRHVSSHLREAGLCSLLTDANLVALRSFDFTMATAHQAISQARARQVGAAESAADQVSRNVAESDNVADSKMSRKCARKLHEAQHLMDM
jgi:hypothetical protein